jgi:hypothetical protein
MAGLFWAFGCTSPAPSVVATPEFTPGAGDYTSSVEVAIVCDTADAVIRYTTDGSDPNESSTAYVDPIHITTTTTIKACAFMEGMTGSGVASGTFTIQVATPAFTPGAGTYTNSVDVAIACDTSEGTIRYTMDGSDPNESSTAYADPIHLTTTTTLKAQAFKAGATASDVATATFAIQMKILPSDPNAWDEFGRAVAASGDVVVVGARRDDDTVLNAGSAYVFRWDGTSWAQEDKLLASDGATDDRFGESVGVSGDVAVVGANRDDDLKGSAYVYRRAGTSWVQEIKLQAAEGVAGDHFGWTVAISGDVVVVGSHRETAYVFRWNGTSWIGTKLIQSDPSGDSFGRNVAISGNVVLVSATQDDDNGQQSGSVYVFRWNGTSWTEEDEIFASDGETYEFFGISVAVSGDVAVVGKATDSDNGTNAGSAYVFRWNGASWAEEAKLLASDGAANDRFGESLTVSGDVIIVGAQRDTDRGAESGSAYVFRWNGTSWVEQAKLLAWDGQTNDSFGISVAILDNLAIVGTPYDDDNGGDSGSAYVFDITP